MTRKNIVFSLIASILTFSCAATATAQIVLTEVDIANGQIEMTNLSATNTPTGLLEWCIPFAYGVLENDGTDFAAGESRTYSVGAMTVAADAVWIYEDRVGGFGNEQFVSSGVVFGTSTVGGLRIPAVVADSGGAVWGSAADFVDTTGIAAGETVQLNYPGTGANLAANWVTAPSTMGSFAIPEPSSAAILMLGLFSMVGMTRRRRA